MKRNNIYIKSYAHLFFTSTPQQVCQKLIKMEEISLGKFPKKNQKVPPQVPGQTLKKLEVIKDPISP